MEEIDLYAGISSKLMSIGPLLVTIKIVSYDIYYATVPIVGSGYGLTIPLELYIAYTTTLLMGLTIQWIYSFLTIIILETKISEEDGKNVL